MRLKEGVARDFDRLPTYSSKTRATVGAREDRSAVIHEIGINCGMVLREDDSFEFGLAGIESTVVFTIEYYRPS